MLTCSILQISQSSDASDVEESGNKRRRKSSRIEKNNKKEKIEAQEREIYLSGKIENWVTEIGFDEGEAQS